MQKTNFPLFGWWIIYGDMERQLTQKPGDTKPQLPAGMDTFYSTYNPSG